MSKNIFLMALVCSYLFGQSLSAQNVVTLDEAITNAVNKAPSSLIFELAKTEKDLSVKNLNSKYLPQISIGGQATYQSETTGLDLNFPGVSIPRLTKDQYKVQLDANQVIYDGGIISTQKQMKNITAELEMAQANMDIEMIREQIIQVFFAVLETQARIEILKLKQADIIAVQKKMEVAVANGVILKSELSQLQVEQISVNQMEAEIRGIRKNQIEILNQLTGQSWTGDTSFDTPKQVLTADNIAITKPTLTYLELQKVNLDQVRKMDKSMILPKVSLFAQAGYGKPGLNFLKNEFSPYYIGGLRVQWNLANLYTNTRDREINLVQKERVDVRKLAYLQQLNIKINSQKNDMERLSTIMPSDQNIVNLRKEIKQTAAIQLENGTKTTSDFILKVNDENEAALNQQIHKIQYLKSSYLLQHHIGNFSK